MISSMARRKRQRQLPRLLRPLKPPKPERPAITANSPKLLRAVELFAEYQVAAGKWMTTHKEFGRCRQEAAGSP